MERSGCRVAFDGWNLLFSVGSWSHRSNQSSSSIVLSPFIGASRCQANIENAHNPDDDYLSTEVSSILCNDGFLWNLVELLEGITSWGFSACYPIDDGSLRCWVVLLSRPRFHQLTTSLDYNWRSAASHKDSLNSVCIIYVVLSVMGLFQPDGPLSELSESYNLE